MPAKAELHVERMLEEVTWDWQPLEPLITKLMPLVPPGKAKRKYEQRAAAARARNTGEGPTRDPLSEDEKIASGARTIVRDAIWSRKTTRFELAEVNGTQQIRFRSLVRPGDQCPTCGHKADPQSPSQSSAPSPAAATPKQVGAMVLEFPTRMSG